MFQVRRGGIKGLLVRYPDDAFDRHCRKHPQARRGHFMIAYRPSMFKYGGGPTVLELNNHNSPPPAARLNIQFTALLLTLGVPLEVFRRLVQDQLDLIASILNDREKALQYIKGDLDAAADDDFVQGREPFYLPSCYTPFTFRSQFIPCCWHNRTCPSRK